MRRFIATLTLIVTFSTSYVLPPAALTTIVLTQTACPKQSDFDRLAKASQELAHDTVLAVDAVVILHKSGKLSLGAKERALDKLEIISTNGKRFNQTLISLNEKYKGQELPPDAIAFVRDNFREISKPFYELLSELNLFGAGSAARELSTDVKTIEEVIGK